MARPLNCSYFSTCTLGLPRKRLPARLPAALLILASLVFVTSSAVTIVVAVVVGVALATVEAAAWSGRRILAAAPRPWTGLPTNPSAKLAPRRTGKTAAPRPPWCTLTRPCAMSSGTTSSRHGCSRVRRAAGGELGEVLPGIIPRARRKSPTRPRLLPRLISPGRFRRADDVGDVTAGNLGGRTIPPEAGPPTLGYEVVERGAGGVTGEGGGGRDWNSVRVLFP